MDGQTEMQLSTSMNMVSLLLITHYEGVLPGHEDSHQ